MKRAYFWAALVNAGSSSSGARPLCRRSSLTITSPRARRISQQVRGQYCCSAMAAVTRSSSGPASARRRSSTSVQDRLLGLISRSGVSLGPVAFVTATIGEILSHSTGDRCLKARTGFFLWLLVSRHPEHPPNTIRFFGTNQTRNSPLFFSACLARHGQHAPPRRGRGSRNGYVFPMFASRRIRLTHLYLGNSASVLPGGSELPAVTLAGTSLLHHTCRGCRSAA
jgi:hypothetical protein